jgi:hypothetical protein
VAEKTIEIIIIILGGISFISSIASVFLSTKTTTKVIENRLERKRTEIAFIENPRLVYRKYLPVRMNSRYYSMKNAPALLKIEIYLTEQTDPEELPVIQSSEFSIVDHKKKLGLAIDNSYSSLSPLAKKTV